MVQVLRPLSEFSVVLAGCQLRRRVPLPFGSIRLCVYVCTCMYTSHYVTPVLSDSARNFGAGLIPFCRVCVGLCASEHVPRDKTALRFRLDPFSPRVDHFSPLFGGSRNFFWAFSSTRRSEGLKTQGIALIVGVASDLREVLHFSPKKRKNPPLIFTYSVVCQPVILWKIASRANWKIGKSDFPIFLTPSELRANFESTFAAALCWKFFFDGHEKWTLP